MAVAPVAPSSSSFAPTPLPSNETRVRVGPGVDCQ